MTWMNKIKEYGLVILLIVVVVLNVISLVQSSFELKECKIQYKVYRAELINELCNNGNGNYDFCVLKKAEYTFVERNKNSVVIPDEKNKKIEISVKKINNENIESEK